MIYAYRCEHCGKQFDVQATLAEKERGLHPRCPDCNSREVLQDFSGVGILTRSGGGGAAPPFCGPGSGAGCC